MTCLSLVRGWLVILGAVILPSLGASLSAVPAATIGRSDDPWEGNPELEPRRTGQCHGPADWVDPPFFVEVPAGSQLDVTRRLEQSSVVPLDDRTAAQLLAIADPGIVPLATVYLNAVIAEREMVRSNALNEHRESWSLADQNVLDGLVAIRAGSRLRNLRPYLVRGLVNRRSAGIFSVIRCGSTLIVQHTGDGEIHTRPLRTALVIFLESPAEDVFVQWAVVNPNQRH